MSKECKIIEGLVGSDETLYTLYNEVYKKIIEGSNVFVYSYDLSKGQIMSIILRMHIKEIFNIDFMDINILKKKHNNDIESEIISRAYADLFSSERKYGKLYCAREGEDIHRVETRLFNYALNVERAFEHLVLDRVDLMMVENNIDSLFRTILLENYSNRYSLCFTTKNMDNKVNLLEKINEYEQEFSIIREGESKWTVLKR